MLVVTGRFEARIVVETDWKKEHRYFRQTGVSRHHGGPIEGPPEIPRTSLHYSTEELKGSKTCSEVALPVSKSKVHTSYALIYANMLIIC